MTKANLILKENNIYHVGYCSSDNYPEYSGKNLYYNYCNRNAVMALIEKAPLYLISSIIEECKTLDGESPSYETFLTDEDLNNYLENGDGRCIDYTYLFDSSNNNNLWYFNACIKNLAELKLLLPNHISPLTE